MRSFSFVVYDTPKPLGRPRFTRLPGGAVRAYMPKSDQNQRFNIRAAYLAASTVESGGEIMGLPVMTGPIRLTVTAWLPMPKSIPKKRRQPGMSMALPTKRPDLDNYVKQVEDALTAYAFKDDSQVVTIIARKRYVPDDSIGPHWDIELQEVDDGPATANISAG